MSFPPILIHSVFQEGDLSNVTLPSYRKLLVDAEAIAVQPAAKSLQHRRTFFPDRALIHLKSIFCGRNGDTEPYEIHEADVRRSHRTHQRPKQLSVTNTSIDERRGEDGR